MEPTSHPGDVPRSAKPAWPGRLAGVGAWYADIKLTNQNIALWKYKSGGGGLNMFVNGKRTIGLDVNKVRLGGKKIGKDYMLPAVDLHQLGIKHFPWKQLDKYKRGAYR